MASKTALCAIFAALCPALAFAATLTVTVRDPGGAVVRDAAVSVTPPAGAALPEQRTNDQGRAVFDNLSPGSHLVSVTKEGFETYKGQAIAGRQTSSLNVQLRIAKLSSSIKVTGGRSPLANSDPNYIALRNGKLSQTYRVENFTLTRDVGTFFFRSGSFSFGPEVLGHVAYAAFAGEGSFRLKPAFDLASKHLHAMMGADEVAEDFTSLVIYFTDSTYDEIVKNSRLEDDSSGKQEQAFRRVNKILQTRRVQRNALPPVPMKGSMLPQIAVSHQLTQLEEILNYQDIPNYDAEVLAEIYNGETGSFRAFIHGRKHEDLRFLVNPRGALTVLHTPEEVALLNFAPASNALPKWDGDGLWYLSHTAAELQSGRANSAEDKRLIAPEHYRIESFIGRENALGNRPDLQVRCSLRFHPLGEKVRMVKFDLVPDLQIQRVLFDGVEIPFVQESRNQDGSFYLQTPKALTKDRTYEVTFDYSGGEVVQTDIDTGVPLRRVWYPMPSGTESRATYDLTFHTPTTIQIVAVGRLANESREGRYDVTEWVSDAPITQAIFRIPAMDTDPVSENSTEENTHMAMAVYLHFMPPNAATPYTPSKKAILNYTGQLLRLFSDWFARTPGDHMSIVPGTLSDSLPGLVFARPVALAGYSAVEAAHVPVFLRTAIDESYPTQIAHEWWGNLLTPSTFHDVWLTDGLANFSASLFDTAADNDEYLDHWVRASDALFAHGRWGVVNPLGPLWMGMMNDTNFRPWTSNILNANKGGFVIQMLRGMMWDPQTGDRDFQAMLRDFVAQYANCSVSSENFQTVVEKHMKGAMDMDGNHRMNWFFREWLYTTDVPAYRLEYSLKPGENGQTLFEGKLTQSGVSADFQMPVPVFAETAGRWERFAVAGIRGNATRTFQVTLPYQPKKIRLNLNHDILTTGDEVSGIR